MDKQIRGLRQRKAETVEAMMAMLTKADRERRDLTQVEQANYDELARRVKTLDATITREVDAVLAAAQITPAGVALDVPDSATIYGGDPMITRDPKHGFRSFGEFSRVVRAQGSNIANPSDERLRIGAATPTTFGNELSGADGGFLVPPEFSRDIFQHAFSEDSLLPLTDNMNVRGNSMVFPRDETTPWGTDGVRAYWQAEATAGMAAKPKIGTETLRLYKLMALVPISDELMADTTGLDRYLAQNTGQRIRWKANEAILFGSGSGQPLGAFNSSAVVTVQKETGQADYTLVLENLAKMLARLPEESFGRAVWLINNDVMPALPALNNTSGTAGVPGAFPIWASMGVGGGGVQTTSPYGNLFTRPVSVTQHAKSFGNQGDILLFDPYYVRSITKGGIRTDMSMHLYFDADVLAFRTTFRMDSKPKIVNPIAPYNGSNSLSPFVQLGARRS